MSIPDDPKPIKTINIDPTGNLLIITIVPARNAKFQFRVSSKILSLASPLFASLFKDPTSHSKQYEIIIRGDSPESLGTLLELCHLGRTSPLPPAQLRGIHALALLSQKYAIASPLVPWITIWAEPLHKLESLDFSKGDDLRKWLKISCVYNQGSLFKKITKQAILTGSAESLDVSSSSDEVHRSIIDKIIPERIDVLSKIIAIALTLLGQYQTPEPICKQSTDSARCDAILLGSVLKGLMGLGVYQPIPEAPYPGMTVVHFVEKMEKLPFMWDSSHGEVCGEEIRGEMTNLMELINRILENVQGLELKGFVTKNGVEQAKDLVLTEVGSGEERQEGGEQADEKKKEGNVETKSRFEEHNDDLVDAMILSSVSESGSIHPVPEPQVPAGVIEGFLETAETIKDFGPQILFNFTKPMKEGVGKEEENERGRGRKRENNHTRKPVTEEQKGHQERMKTIANAKIPSENEGWGGGKRIHGTNDASLKVVDKDTKAQDQFREPVKEDKPKESLSSDKKEQLRPTAREYVPSTIQYVPTPQRNHRTSHTQKEETVSPQQAPIAHATARANAEAQGITWSTPGPDLVQRFQRGPRYPFHPEVTVGDVSDEEHTAEVKRLKDLFPQVDNKILVEFLRQSCWDSQDAARLLTSGLSMNTINDNIDGSPGSSRHTLEPIVLSRQDSITANGKEAKQVLELPQENTSTLQAPPITKRNISISRLVAGTSNAAKVDLKFWPEADKAVVSRALKDPENKKSIKKLLAMFPQASADKGFIDVLYRNGWDLEKAARKLEKLGLVREVAGSSIDGDEVKSDGKGKGK